MEVYTTLEELSLFLMSISVKKTNIDSIFDCSHIFYGKYFKKDTFWKERLRGTWIAQWST